LAATTAATATPAAAAAPAGAFPGRGAAVIAGARRGAFILALRLGFRCFAAVVASLLRLLGSLRGCGRDRGGGCGILLFPGFDGRFFLHGVLGAGGLLGGLFLALPARLLALLLAARLLAAPLALLFLGPVLLLVTLGPGLALSARPARLLVLAPVGVAVFAIAALTAATALLAATLCALAGLAGAIVATSGRLRRRRGRTADQRLQPAHEPAAGRCRRGRSSRGRGGCRGCGCLLARLPHRGRLRRAHVAHGRGRHVEVGLVERDRRHLARSAALVAGTAGFLAQLVLADPGDLVVRGLQMLVGDDHDRRLVPALDLRQRGALLVEQVVGDLQRRLHQHLAGVVLHRVLLGDADDREAQRFDAAHAAVALAARADDLAGFTERGAQALAAHLQQAELGDTAQLHAGAVVLERALQAVLDLALVLVGGHVDEVDHHQAAQVAQAQLAGHLVGGLQVGVERGFLDVTAARGAGRVHVDRGQRLGLVDHQRAARGQVDGALVGALDLRLDLEPVEQRGVVGVV